jgi:hypothetical protein
MQQISSYATFFTTFFHEVVIAMQKCFATFFEKGNATKSSKITNI